MKKINSLNLKFKAMKTIYFLLFLNFIGLNINAQEQHVLTSDGVSLYISMLKEAVHPVYLFMVDLDREVIGLKSFLARNWKNALK